MSTTFRTAVIASGLVGGLVAGAAPAAGSAHDVPARSAANARTAPAAAPTVTVDRPVAFLRYGDLYLAQAAEVRRLTTGGGHSRPRWSPDGQRLAFLRADQLWTMKADGTDQRRLTTRHAGGPAWSPDGRWIAFAATGCTGGPAIYRISATSRNGQPEALFPAECRGEPLPADFPGIRATGTLAQRLRWDNAVAWSPDGDRIAFRGGRCEAIYDDCLTLGNVATGGERVLAAWGGGGMEYSGFAVVPAFRSDGAKVTWTGHQTGHDAATTLPVHVVEQDVATGEKRRIGVGQDREMVYLSATRGLLTGVHQGRSWLIAVDLTTGARTPFVKGSQPTIRP